MLLIQGIVDAPEGYQASGYYLLEGIIDIVTFFCRANVPSVNAFDFVAHINKEKIIDMQSPPGCVFVNVCLTLFYKYKCCLFYKYLLLFLLCN